MGSTILIAKQKIIFKYSYQIGPKCGIRILKFTVFDPNRYWVEHIYLSILLITGFPTWVSTFYVLKYPHTDF